MKTYMSRKARAKKYLSNISLLWIILALTFAACADREAGEMGEMGSTGEVRAEEGLTGTEATPAMPVSVMGPGYVMPTLPAGQATFTVDNTGTEDCMLTLIPQTSDSQMMMGQGTMGRGTAAGTMHGADDRAGADPAEDQNEQARREDMNMADTSTTAAGTTTPEARSGMTGQGMRQGQQNNRVAAGQTSTVTVDLQPGMYEVSCVNEGTATQQTPDETSNALPGMRMLVMVTDARTMGTGMNDPREPYDIDR